MSIADLLTEKEKEELSPKKVAETKEPAEPAASKKKKSNGYITDIHYTDFGNAQKMVILHGIDIRHDHQAKKWYTWNKKRWQPDNTGQIIRKAKDTVKSLYKDAYKIEDDDAREALIKHALKSESSNRIKAMISLAESEPGTPITQDQFNRDPFLLNCLNGTIDLRTGELREHRREDYITKLAPVEVAPGIRSDLWENFIRRVLPNEENRAFVQRAAGYSLTGDTGEEKLFFAYGPPATGKSTLLRAIAAAIGDYAATADFEAFLINKNTGGPRNDIARLAGRRFVTSVEVDDGRRLAEGLVNQLTGGDTVTARFLYSESFEFIPQFKLWLAANNRPRVTGTDGAIWRRILQIPFMETIPEGERDPRLKQKLSEKKNLQAILAWLIEGCLEWQRHGLKPPKIVKETTEEYKQEMDPLTGFISDCCIIAGHAQVKNPELWKAYTTWCRENGEKYPLGRKKFTQALSAKGFDQYRDGKNRIWIGVGLTSDTLTLSDT